MSEVHEAYAPFGLFDGQIKAHNDLHWPLSDTALLRGEGLFETMRTTPLGCPAYGCHRERLTLSVTSLKLLPLETWQSRLHRLEKALAQLWQMNAAWLQYHGEACARLTVTRYHDSLTLQALTPNQHHRRQGLNLKLLLDQRGDGLLTRHKSLSWGLSSLVMQGLSPNEEGLWMHTDKTLLEGLTSTLFVRRGGVLHTPSLEFPILPGTTRARVLKLAPQMGLHVREGKVVLDDLFEAEEVFMTSALLPVSPVLAVDAKPLSQPSQACWPALREALLSLQEPKF